MFVCSLLVFMSMLFFGCEKQEVNLTDELLQSFKEETPNYKLYYLGKQENMLDLEVNYINKITEIPFDEAHENMFIVINNLDDCLDFDLSELIQLKENIERYQVAFYYFGLTHLDVFHDSGLLIHEAMDPSSLSFGYVKEGNQFINAMGTWDVEANELVKTNELLFVVLLVSEFTYHFSMVS